MAPAHCPAQDDPHTQWPPMCPSLGAAYFFAVLFAATTIAHIAQGIIYRKGYSWVVAMSALWQTVAYISRVLSIQYVDNNAWYSVWFILILLAPLWINAYVYMVLGRMVYNYTHRAKIFGIKAWRFGLCFVLLDIFAFMIQVAGASTATGDGKPQETIMMGLHIYMGGIGFQQFFLLAFFAITIRSHNQMQRATAFSAKHRCGPRSLLYVVYAVLVLITVRIIFRLVEYAKGYSSGIPVHEEYQYVLDSTPMLIALVLFNIVHPGRVMAGKEADFPSRKERKAVGKDHVWGRADEHVRDESPLSDQESSHLTHASSESNMGPHGPVMLPSPYLNAEGAHARVGNV